jgi:hypothetical protein
MYDAPARKVSGEVAARLGAREALHIDTSSVRLGIVFGRNRRQFLKLNTRVRFLHPLQSDFFIENSRLRAFRTRIFSLALDFHTTAVQTRSNQLIAVIESFVRRRLFCQTRIL